jgi:putative transposase
MNTLKWSPKGANKRNPNPESDMSTFTQIYYHIIYSTKNRLPILKPERREELFRYIWGILKNKHCRLYRLNGADDHLHYLTHLHPTVDLASLIRDIKTSTTSWMKSLGIDTRFPGWQDGYGAFTKSHSDKDAVIEYIKRQEEHHKRETFVEEIKRLLKKEGVPFDEKYLK